MLAVVFIWGWSHCRFARCLCAGLTSRAAGFVALGWWVCYSWVGLLLLLIVVICCEFGFGLGVCLHVDLWVGVVMPFVGLLMLPCVLYGLVCL